MTPDQPIDNTFENHARIVLGLAEIETDLSEKIVKGLMQDYAMRITQAIREENEACAKLAEEKRDLWTKNIDGSSIDISDRIKQLSIFLQTAILENAVSEKETAAAIRSRLKEDSDAE